MHRTLLVSLLALASSASVSLAQTPAPTEQAKPRQLAISNKPWTGDFDKMLERRVIRVYAPFSRSLYLSDKGRERGLAVELVRDWERYLNIKYAKQLGKRPLTVYVAPRFETGDERYAWLNRIQAVGKGTVNEDLSVDYEWYEVR